MGGICLKTFLSGRFANCVCDFYPRCAENFDRNNFRKEGLVGFISQFEEMQSIRAEDYSGGGVRRLVALCLHTTEGDEGWCLVNLLKNSSRTSAPGRVLLHSGWGFLP